LPLRAPFRRFSELSTLNEDFSKDFVVMYTLPAADLLEQSHSFPCTYTFKVIGKPEGGFLARTLGAARAALALETDPPFKVREAVGGRHIAITLVPEVQSAEQVLAVYRRLQPLAGLVYLW